MFSNSVMMFLSPRHKSDKDYTARLKVFPKSLLGKIQQYIKTDMPQPIIYYPSQECKADWIFENQSILVINRCGEKHFTKSFTH